ncbi:MAG: flippase-like domain-containing protein [Bacteriovorax sp.]|jgi:uncharacterized protein (TIRG00374 family)|nr:flippase-like domain-containing protein [Bacteriovorax sp.]
MIKTLLKFLLAITLIVWLLTSGKLDFSLIRKAFTTGPQWLMALFLFFIQVAICSFRYKLLLETKSKINLQYLKILRLNYIGVFFSSVLPGAVTGDLIKLIYVKKLDDHFSNTFLVSITLLDRIMGLTALLFLSGTFSFLYYSEMTSLSPRMAHVIFINGILFIGACSFFMTLIAPKKYQDIIHILFIKIPFIGKKLSDQLNPIFALREKKKDLFICFTLSLFVQFLSILTFWLLTKPFIEQAFPLKYAFTFIPVGLTAMAIPISPGGLGVGHALFANLFSIVHIDNGASLFNLFFVCNLAHNCIGVIPYLTIRNKHLS